MYFKSNARVDKVKIESLTTEVESLKIKADAVQSLEKDLILAKEKILELELENKTLLAKIEELTKEPVVEQQEESQAKTSKPGRKRKGDSEDAL